jgi:hypothetical protein
MKILFCSLVLLFTFAAAGADAANIRGKLFLPKEDKPSFFFENTREKSGKREFSRVKFTDKEGKLLVEEEFHYSAGALEKYSYKQHQVDEHGTIEIRDGKVHYNYSAQGKIDIDEEPIPQDMILPDLIGPFLVKNWESLLKGESLKVHYLLLERQESIGFKFYKDNERILNGVEVVDFIMKATNIFVAQLAPKIRFTLEKAAPHRVIETYGRMPIRIAEVPNPRRRKDYKAIDARMEWEYVK